MHDDDKMEAFVAWFQAEASALRELDSPVLSELIGRRLALLEPRLGALTWQPGDGQNTHAIITAYAESSLFDLVEALVARIGPLDGWTVIPLKQPYHSEFTARCAGYAIETATLRYMQLPGVERGILLLLPEGTPLPDRADIVDELASMVLEARLGERLAAEIDHVELAESSATLPAFPFSGLQAYVESWLEA